MEHTRLGATGLEVSRLALGTMTFGREIGEPGSHRLLNRFTEAGGTLIDTADGYNEGRSEEFVGSWLAGRRRDDLVIATKARFGSGPNRRGLSRKHLLNAVDASLRRLRTDHIDLYQLHMWDYHTPIEETLRALDTIVTSGRARYLGVSNVTAAQLQRTASLCRSASLEPVISLQPLYNLLDREAEWDLIPTCRSEGIGVLPYSPLRGGWLSGKFHRAPTAEAASTRPASPRAESSRASPSRAEPSRAESFRAESSHAESSHAECSHAELSRAEVPSAGRTRLAGTDRPGEPTWTEAWANYAFDERTWTVVETLAEVAVDIGRTPAQTALNWLLHRPGVTAPIIGARTLDQLDDNLAAATFTMDPAHHDRLDRASDKPKPYPYQLLSDLRDV